jgi:hypothetical protein
MKFVIPAVRTWSTQVPWERKPQCWTDMSTVSSGCRPHADDIQRVHRLVTTGMPPVHDRLGLCWEYWTMTERPAILHALIQDWSSDVLSHASTHLALVLELEHGSLLAYMIAYEHDQVVYRPLDWCLELLDKAQEAIRHLYQLITLSPPLAPLAPLAPVTRDLDIGILDAWLRDVQAP